jgi:hypothetical protein
VSVSAFATIDDYVTWTGQTSMSDAQRARVSMKLDGVSALIRAKLPPGYEPDADVAKMLVLAIVQRAETNTGGLRSKTVGGVALTFDQDGGLYITDDEWEALLSGWDEGSSGAYTVGLRDDAFPPCPGEPLHVPYRYRNERDWQDRHEYSRRWRDC